jgi:predicted branched-subunit amino acid permease
LKTTRARDWLDGAKDGLLFIPLYLPLALSYAVAAKAAGLDDWLIVLWSAATYAVSAQLACLSALSGGATLVQLLIITFMANARHGFVAMSLVPYLTKVRPTALPLIGFSLATSSIGLLPARLSRGGQLESYALSTQICQWGQWVIFTLGGLWLGPLLPTSWAPVIAFSVPAAFLGLLAPMVREDLAVGLVVAMASAGLGLVLTIFWPPQLCAIVGSVAGSAAGLVVSERRNRVGQ